MKKKISRFKKWYKMAFMQSTKNIYANIIIQSSDSKKSFINRLELDKNKHSNIDPDNEKSHLISKNKVNKIQIERIKSFDTTHHVERARDSILIKNTPLTDKLVLKPFKLSENSDNEVLNNFTINQAEIGLRNFIRNDNFQLFVGRIIKGPPEDFRWLSWIIAGDVNENRDGKIYDFYLNENVDRNTEFQIKKDIYRTLKNESINIDKVKFCLYCVLRAYAACDSEVLYCQGMNFIAGFLLLVSDINQVDTFYLFRSLFQSEKFNLRGFYIDEFPFLKLYIYQFDHIFKEKLPNLKKHFEKLEVPNELWICKWIQTLYTICIPFELLVRLWDCILAKGLNFILNFTFALLDKYEKELLKLLDLSDISDFFKNIGCKMKACEYEELINCSLEMSIPQSLLDKLRTEFETEFKIYPAFCKLENKDLENINLLDFSDNEYKSNFKEFSHLMKRHPMRGKFSSISIINTTKFCKIDKTKSTLTSIFDKKSHIQTTNFSRDKASYTEDLSCSKSSEIDCKDNNKINDKIKSHTLLINKLEKKVSNEESEVDRISSMNNVKINLVKPYFEKKPHMEVKNPFR